MTSSVLRIMAFLVLTLALSLFGVALAIDLTGSAPRPEDLALAASSVMYAFVGLLVLRQHPRQPVGWLLLAIGSLGTAGGATQQVTEAVLVDGRGLPGMIWAAWVGDWYWVPWLWAQFVLLPLLFPTGAVPSPRWKPLARAVVAMLVTTTVVAAFSRSLWLDEAQVGVGVGSLTLDNPLGFLPIENIESPEWEGILFGLFFAALAAIASLVARFRAADGATRRQIKLGVYGLVVTVVAFVAFAMLDALGGQAWVAQGVLLSLIPVTLGIAVLRDGLYDVDRIISRTVAYAIATAVLVGAYLGSVVVAQTVLRPITGESDVAVAASTLVVAALFRPVLRRVQAAVDRRFHRRRYDAQRTVATFGQRLRDDVDLGSLVTDLGGTVREVVEPRDLSVWVAAPGGGRR